MSEYKFDSDRLKAELSSLAPFHRVAFAAACCERLLPNYNAFSKMECWGEPLVLRAALNEVWRSLEENFFNTKKIQELMMKCNAVIPDTENFDSVYTSAALDAGTAILETLACCLDGDPKRATDVASFARDTVDMYLQERDHMDYADPKFEERIANDPLMVRELKKQQEDLKLLKNTPSLDHNFIETFRKSCSKNGKSNIDVG